MKRFSTQTRALQWIDRRIGAPVCWLLTLARRLGFFSSAPSGPWRSILFIKLAEQGSTVLAHEAVRCAIERVGPQRVYFLVFEENRFIVDVLGLVPPENVLTVATGSARAMAGSCLARLRQIRRLHLDACVDLEFFARFSAAIAFLTGIPRRCGFHAYFGEGPYRGDLFTHRLLYNPHWHTSQTFAALVAGLDLDPATLPTQPSVPPRIRPLPLFRPAEGEREAVRVLLRSAGIGEDRRLILLNANAGDLLPLRRWSDGNYVSLARRALAEWPDAAVVFTGSPEEEARTAELARSVGSERCVCAAGRTTLRQLMALYGLAEVLVTNDSGPAHFAALTEIDVVALFGPETPLLFAAPGPRSHPLWAGIACSPCVNAYNNRQSACRNNVCMQALTVDRVFDEVARIYHERAVAKAPAG